MGEGSGTRGLSLGPAAGRTPGDRQLGRASVPLHPVIEQAASDPSGRKPERRTPSGSSGPSDTTERKRAVRPASRRQSARRVARVLALGMSVLTLAVGAHAADGAETATPIKHLVVIFNENVSFDHYFATYPDAANPPGEPAFTAAPGTPAVDNLVDGPPADRQPQLHQHGQWRRRGRSVPAGSHPGQHRRPEPRLHGRAAGL